MPTILTSEDHNSLISVKIRPTILTKSYVRDEKEISEILSSG